MMHIIVAEVQLDMKLRVCASVRDDCDSATPIYQDH